MLHTIGRIAWHTRRVPLATRDMKSPLRVVETSYARSSRGWARKAAIKTRHLALAGEAK